VKYPQSLSFGGILTITNGSERGRGLMSGQDTKKTVPLSLYPCEKLVMYLFPGKGERKSLN